MTSHALRADRVPFPVRIDRRRRSRPERPAPQDPVEGTSVWKLPGLSVLGWFGLMAVVTVLAV
jgi:hypothetical protein